MILQIILKIYINTKNVNSTTIIADKGIVRKRINSVKW